MKIYTIEDRTVKELEIPENYPIPFGWTPIPAPELKEHETAIVAADNTWRILDDYRGTVLYSTDSDFVIPITSPGLKPSNFPNTTTLPRPKYGVWDAVNKKWNIDTERQLADVKQEKLAQIAKDYNAFLAEGSMQSELLGKLIDCRKNDVENLAIYIEQLADNPSLPVYYKCYDNEKVYTDADGNSLTIDSITAIYKSIKAKLFDIWVQADTAKTAAANATSVQEVNNIIWEFK